MIPKRTLYSIFTLALLFAFEGTAANAQDAPTSKVNAAAATNLQFSFDGADWKTVLDWLASESDLTLVVDTLPPGKFNFSDRRSYAPDEAIDIINSWLIARDFVLVRNNQLLVLLNLENEIPETLVREVAIDELKDLGRYEFARCTFVPKTLTTEQVKEEFSALLGDYGEMIVLRNTGRLVVTDMVSQLRTMQSVLGDLESSSGRGGIQVTILPLEHITPEAAMVTVRQMYQIEEEGFATEDGDLRFSVDPTGSKLLLRSQPDKIASVRELLKLIDVSIEGGAEVAAALADPEFTSYALGTTEPSMVLKVMQSMLAGQPEVRLDVSEENKMLYALARPEDQKRILTTLDGMKAKGDEIEVFPLNVLDADLAKSRIESLIGTKTTDGDGVVTYDGPRIVADATRRVLIVNGNPEHIDRVRSFLKKMGETSSEDNGSVNMQTIRVVPMDGVVTKAVLDRAMEIWPTMRPNAIKVVIPETSDATIREQINEGEAKEAMEADDGGGEDAAGGASENSPKTVKRAPAVRPQHVIQPVTYLAQVKELPPAVKGTKETDMKKNSVTNQGDAGDASNAGDKATPQILVTPGSGGLVIASDDLEALDEFEELVRLLSDPFLFPASDTVVFRLKHAKADQTKALLDQLLGNSSGGGSGGGDGGLGAIMGADMGLGALDSILGSGGTAGAVTITTDARLNTLFVQAEALDVDRVAELIKVIDVAESPIKVATRPIPRVIPLRRANATELAQTLQVAFPSESGGGGGGGAGGGQAIQQLIKQIGGGGGRGGGARGGGGGQAAAGGGGPEVSIAADQRSNSLVVVAPDQIYDEIKSLALYLDETATESTEITVVVPVTRANPEAIQTALNSVFGQQVVASAGKPAEGGASGGGSSQRSGGTSGQLNPDAVKAIQQRIQSFREAAGARGGGDRGRGGERGRPSGGRGR